MPLFSYPPAPLMLSTPGVESATAVTAVVAGAAYASLVQVLAPVTITQMRTSFSGTPTGNVDLGIYDATGANGYPGNLLAHTGANAAATGTFTKNLTANITLTPGNYWLAFVDTVADSVAQSRSVNASGIAALTRTTSTSLTVLPASFGANSDSNIFLVVLGIVNGGYS